MSLYTLMSIIVTIAAMIAYLNSRFLKLPTTIAIMSGSLLISLVLLTVGQFGHDALEVQVGQMLLRLDFRKLLMEGMLSFLLFAGALTVDFSSLKDSKWEIITLASLGTIASTFIIGTLVFYLLPFLGYPLPYLECLLFGALISPTDPIAVLAIFKEIGAPKQLDVTVSGESLFNDGVGIVLFLTLYQLTYGQGAPTIASVSLLFLRQAIGGIFYGIALGVLGYKLIKPIDDYKVEILITLAMATGGYVLANAIDISGPLAMVTAGIFIGNKGRGFSMSTHTRENLDNFWELVDEILNAVLFLLIGLELLAIKHEHWQFVAGLLAIPIVLMSRFVIVSLPMHFFKLKKQYPPNFTKILVWGGLRGGLAVALALALPVSPARDLILTMTYAVVIFAIIVQGLTIKPLLSVNQST